MIIVKKFCYFFLCFTDAPKFISNQTIYYSWEGNPINISCDVKSNPPASVYWRKEKLVLPAKNTTNLRTYSSGRKMILEVSLDVSINKLCYFRIHLMSIIISMYCLPLSMTVIHLFVQAKVFHSNLFKVNFMCFNRSLLVINISLFTYSEM